MWPSEIAVGPDTATLNVCGVLRPARRARQWAQRQLQSWDISPELIEDVELVISELVTNAAVHAPPPRSIHLWRSESELLVAVVDSAQTQPVAREQDTVAEAGRGLQLVGHFALRWGASVFPLSEESETASHDDADNGPHKMVWCAFPLAIGKQDQVKLKHY